MEKAARPFRDGNPTAQRWGWVGALVCTIAWVAIMLAMGHTMLEVLTNPLMIMEAIVTIWLWVVSMKVRSAAAE